MKIKTNLPYKQVQDWPRLPEHFILGNPTGMDMDKDQNLVVFHRGSRIWPSIGPIPESRINENTILIIDKHSGNILRSWGEGIFIMPHGLKIDRDNNIWVTDCGLHQVLKFSHDGKMLMQLGEAKIPGHDSTHFNKPTDVAFAPDGSFYVADGYGNSRVVKFSAAGHFLLEWGRKGDKQGEFNIPHGIDVDDQGNVYVADRENNRIQQFDANGKFIKSLENTGFGRICALRWSHQANSLVAVDYLTRMLVPMGSDILFFDSTGKVHSKFGRSGNYNGPVGWYHDMTIDKEGNIYVGDILNNSILKFGSGLKD
ncbi:MAG: peptidyl-alpha-hydroxyglycine alpha-amidating lyase family protein [Chitinophagales bacterium]